MAEIKELLVLLTFLRQTRIQKGQKQRSVETLGLSGHGDTVIIAKCAHIRQHVYAHLYVSNNLLKTFAHFTFPSHEPATLA